MLAFSAEWCYNYFREKLRKKVFERKNKINEVGTEDSEKL
jgi:hypothetical protein